MSPLWDWTTFCERKTPRGEKETFQSNKNDFVKMWTLGDLLDELKNIYKSL